MLLDFKRPRQPDVKTYALVTCYPSGKTIGTYHVGARTSAEAKKYLSQYLQMCYGKSQLISIQHVVKGVNTPLGQVYIK